MDFFKGLLRAFFWSLPVWTFLACLFWLDLSCSHGQMLIVGFPQIPPAVVCADPQNCTPAEQALIDDRLAKLETLRIVERGMAAWYGGPYSASISEQGPLYSKEGQPWTFSFMESNAKVRCDLLKAAVVNAGGTCQCWKKENWSGWLTSQGYIAVGGGE